MYNIHKQRQNLQEGFDRLQVKEDDLSKKEEDVLALQSNTEELIKKSGMRCILVTSIYLSNQRMIRWKEFQNTLPRLRDINLLLPPSRSHYIDYLSMQKKNIQFV